METFELGRISPTSDEGDISKTTPQGAPTPFNPIALAIAADISFVARGFAGEINHLADLLKEAIKHKGFALVDILQPCPSFNHRNTFSWYRERVYPLGEDYDPGDKLAAFAKAQEWRERIPIGIIHRKERPTFEERLSALQKGPLVKQKIAPGEIAALLNEFR